jgi:hypothetical protein
LKAKVSSGASPVILSPPLADEESEPTEALRSG